MKLTAEQIVTVLSDRDALDEAVLAHQATIEKRRDEIVSNAGKLFGARHRARTEWLEQQMKEWGNENEH